MASLRLIISENSEQATLLFSEGNLDMSMRQSTLNLQSNTNPFGMTSITFEEVKSKDHTGYNSTALNTNRDIMTERSTDVVDLRASQSLGCGTNIQTVEKEISAVKNTKDCGS